MVRRNTVHFSWQTRSFNSLWESQLTKLMVTEKLRKKNSHIAVFGIIIILVKNLD